MVNSFGPAQVVDCTEIHEDDGSIVYCRIAAADDRILKSHTASDCVKRSQMGVISRRVNSSGVTSSRLPKWATYRTASRGNFSMVFRFPSELADQTGLQ